MKASIGLIVLGVLALASGCATTRVPCDAHLTPINPAPAARVAPGASATAPRHRAGAHP